MAHSRRTFFRDLEKERLIPLKGALFSERVGTSGEYGGARRAFCLERAHSQENLWSGIRADAIAYFGSRGIRWHDGVRDEAQGTARPSNHLCCSQTSCVNTLFPFMQAPDELKKVLWGLGFEIERMLPFDADAPGKDGTTARKGRYTPPGYVAFEWIGTKNYLGEHGPRGKPAGDDTRRRGAHYTSADFAFLMEHRDGETELVLGEWKYTEYYARGRSLRYSRPSKPGAKGTDRLAIYAPFFDRPVCQLSRLGSLSPEDLMYDPFDQLMRLQLLAGEMERRRELGADRVTVLHVAPSANHDLMDIVTSPALARAFPEANVHEVWNGLVTPGCFKGIAFEDVVFEARRHAVDLNWMKWMQTRYTVRDPRSLSLDEVELPPARSRSERAR